MEVADSTNVLVLLAEEELTRIRTASDRFWTSRLLQMSSKDTRQRSDSAGFLKSYQKAAEIVSLKSSLLGSVLDEFLLSQANVSAGSNADALNKSIFHILSILRHVRLRSLYALSGWQANESEINEARTTLQHWFENDTKSARKCLWHAGSVFQALRTKTHFACFEPFNLLIAALVIWAYCLLRPQVPRAAAMEQLNHYDGGRPAVKIDQLSHQTAVDAWIQGNNEIVHLTGAGILSGPEGARRVMRELHRILMSRTGWSAVCRGIAFAVEQLMSGGRPDFSEEHA